MKHLAPLIVLLLAPLAFAAPPNIVYILADDLGYNDVGFNGGKEIKTPALDALAASGARLERYYVQPVCSPTRAALMTGRYPMRLGLQVGVIRPWAKYGLGLEERMLPQALHDVGYTTIILGKWHLGSFDKTYFPTARGFDHHYGHLFGAIDYFTHIRDGKLDWYRDGEPLKEEGYTTHLLAAEAVKVIKNQPKDKPLFLYLAFNAVHAPHQVPDRYKEPYAALKGQRRIYAGMLAAMDEAIGQVTAALDAKGIRDNTLIVFSSDNGGPNPGNVTDNGMLRAGKGTLYEGGVRVAACASFPGKITAGSVVKEPIHIIDMYPTLLTLAGVSLDQKQPIDGRDAWATLTQNKPTTRTEIILNSTPSNGAMIAGDWKLVINGGKGAAADEEAPDQAEKPRKRAANAAANKVELFNLADDLREKSDLAAAQPEKVKELRARYDALASQALPPKNAPAAKEK